MEQLNSMFIRLKRGLYAGGDHSSQPPEKQQSMTNNNNAPSPTDGMHEDEGFVLVNQNECAEHATAFGKMNMAVRSHSSAPYSETSTRQAADRAGKDFAMFATCDHLAMDSAQAVDAHDHDHAQGITDHPAVVGVPFQINPKLQEKDRLQNMLSQLDLENTRFDWQKYSYDFHFEQLSLRELCAMEKTGMTDSGARNYVL